MGLLEEIRTLPLFKGSIKIIEVMGVMRISR